MKLAFGLREVECVHGGWADAAAYLVVPISPDMARHENITKRYTEAAFRNERATRFPELEITPGSEHECHRGIGWVYWVAWLRVPKAPEPEPNADELDSTSFADGEL